MVKFEIPYFTVSGIQVRYLKIVEKSGYQALPWVRYITQHGDDYRYGNLSSSCHLVLNIILQFKDSFRKGQCPNCDYVADNKIFTVPTLEDIDGKCEDATVYQLCCMQND